MGERERRREKKRRLRVREKGERDRILGKVEERERELGEMEGVRDRGGDYGKGGEKERR